MQFHLTAVGLVLTLIALHYANGQLGGGGGGGAGGEDVTNTLAGMRGTLGQGEMQANGAAGFSDEQLKSVVKEISGKERDMKRNMDGSISITSGTDTVKMMIFKVRETDANGDDVCGTPIKNFDPKKPSDDLNDPTKVIAMSEGGDIDMDTMGIQWDYSDKIVPKPGDPEPTFEGTSTVFELDDLKIEFESSMSTGDDTVTYEFVDSSSTIVVKPGDTKWTVKVEEYPFCGMNGKTCTCDDGSESMGEFLEVMVRMQPETGNKMGEKPQPKSESSMSYTLGDTSMETRAVSDVISTCNKAAGQTDADTSAIQATVDTFDDVDEDGETIVGMKLKVQKASCSGETFTFVWDPVTGENGAQAAAAASSLLMACLLVLSRLIQ